MEKNSLTADAVRVIPTEEDIREGESIWTNALILQFVGKIVSYSAFLKVLKILWRNFGEFTVSPIGSNLFVVQVVNLDVRDQIIEGGP